MTSIAYLANSFPEPGEPYVWEEVDELRKLGADVSCCSARRPQRVPLDLRLLSDETLYVYRPHLCDVLFGSFLFIAKLPVLWNLLRHVWLRPEPISKKLRTLAHTWLGVLLAWQLRRQGISHIHIHHGYFSSWVGMVAARLLNAGFSLTLHGSDLLVRGDYMGYKLQQAQFCVTISEFNRKYILERYAPIDPSKIVVHRLGVDVDFWKPLRKTVSDSRFSILSVGRLHAVKDHAFLIRACRKLKDAGLRFRCTIAGDGPEHENVQRLIQSLQLRNEVVLIGQMPREQLPELYREADVVVFTSRSEGIPLAAMEAMAMERIVLAPSVTGIPELITDGESGFLYRPGSMDDFLAKLTRVHDEKGTLDHLRHAARQTIRTKFKRAHNLAGFAADFLQRIAAASEAREVSDADPLLQQI
jgi:glycosyltransferase involved in cell wall biosynthesis